MNPETNKKTLIQEIEGPKSFFIIFGRGAIKQGKRLLRLVNYLVASSVTTNRTPTDNS